MGLISFRRCVITAQISWVTWRLSPNRFSNAADADSTSLSFGGGFEIMKAGRDIDGLWTLLESGIWYVPTRVQSVCHVTCPSISAAMSHVPYVVPLLIKIMGERSVLARFRAFCRERVLERLRMGANRKDLFYYLVSSRT